MLLYLLFWAVVCLVAYRILRRAFPFLQSGPKTDSAVQILRERFARGEISAEQFEAILSVLEKSRHS